MKYYVYQQDTMSADHDPELIKEFYTIEEVWESEENELKDCYREMPTEYIPYDKIHKDVEFISWAHSSETIRHKYDSVIYRYSECKVDDWKFIPLNSIYEYDSATVTHRWAEICEE